ncbi:9339_t:CDS:1, partial [Racocetra persica]
NDKNRAEEMKRRMREEGYLMTNFWGGDIYKWPILKMHGIYDQRPTEINISPHTLTTEHSTDTMYGVIRGGDFTYYGSGAGFLPTTAHESAHASKE